MIEITQSALIAGVKFARLAPLADERGAFVETFRKGWFPDRGWEAVQMNCSRSLAGVLRGLHYHHHQTDYWYVVQGDLRAGLVDLRRGSPTQGAAQAVEVGDGNPHGLFIPVGVAHGFLALGNVILTYLVDSYYDASDEYGVAWNDPVLGLDWGLGGAAPAVSHRDQNNPTLADIPPARLPSWSSASC